MGNVFLLKYGKWLLIRASFIRVFTIRGLKKCDPIPIFAVKISLFADRIEISVRERIPYNPIQIAIPYSRFLYSRHIYGTHTPRIKSFYCI
ncbi:hypothetical protein SFRURICE_002242 [Spodoptera frugiperda]|nr:hypothetical protein SFRURICE_002242 [Spodoptera frugiperda]